MKSLKLRLNTNTDHFEEELGPPLPTKALEYSLLPPVQGCRSLVPLPPYYCWCKKGFWDPDECMIHAVNEHPEMVRREGGI